MFLSDYFIYIEKIKTSKIFKSFSYLTLLQFSNYLFPIITFPYLVRVIGPEKFGLLNFVTAFITYFVFITDYGFNLSAVREIAINRDSSSLPSKFNSVLSVKILLLGVSLIIFLPLVFLIPAFTINSSIYLLSFLYVIGTVLFPVWFFQGMEEMKYITFINIGVRFILTLSIFLFIKDESGFLLLITINSLASVIIGLIGIFIVIVSYKMPIIIPSTDEIKYQLKEGWYVFVSIISISFYTISNTVILGLFSSETSVGYFSGADKIRIAFQSIIAVFLQAVFPNIAGVYGKSITDGLKFSGKLLRNILFPVFLLSLILFLFADKLVIIILGEQYLNSILLLRIIAILPIAISISNVLGIQTMLNLGYNKAFFRIVGIMGFFNIVISFILVPKLFEIGSAISMTLTEILVTASMYVFLRKQGINLFKNNV